MKYIVAMDRVIGGEYEYLPIVACDTEWEAELLASEFSIWLDKVIVHYTNCKNDKDSKDELKKSFHSQDIPYRFPPPFPISINVSQLILFNIFSKGHRFFVIDIKEKKDAEGSVSSSPKED